MLYQQPQSGPVGLDLSGTARGALSALLPIFKAADMMLGAPVFNRTTGVVITPDKFSFTATSANIAYDDTASAFFRRSTFTKILRFRLKSLTNGYIYTTDSRFTIGIGVEGITSGQLGVSWYDGLFYQISAPCALNVDYTLIVVATPNGVALYLNGVLVGSTATNAIVYSSNRGAMYGFADYFNLDCTLFDMQFSAYFATAVPPAQALQLSANPYALFLDPDEDDDLLLSASSGATDTPVNPAVGALAITGYSPTVARTANQALTPAAGSLTLTGYAPSVAQSSSVALVPGQGSLAITGYAPSVVVGLNRAVAPGVGSLTITGYAPTVTQAITTAIAPGVGSLSITGYAPSVAQSVNQIAAPAVGALTLTGFAPTLAQSANQALTPAAGAMVITGYAPVITQVSASPSLVPGAGLITITGYEPTITQSGGAGRPKKAFQVETSRGVIEVATLDEVAEIVRTEKRRPKAAPVEVKLEGMKVSTPSLKPNVDYKAIEERMRAQVQAEMDDEEELLMMLL